MIKRDVALTKALFFLFGFGVMAWVPRFPELKAQLGVGNGAFGSMLSTGALGSLIALVTIGHLVDHFGARKLLYAAVFLNWIAFTSIVHIHNHQIFIFVNVLAGFAISTMHISINAQAFNDQDRGGKNLVISAAGFWSAGSLTTTILSMFLIGKISLPTHITFLYAIVFFVTIFVISKRKDTLLPPNPHESVGRSIYNDLRKFNFHGPIFIGSIMGLMLEYSIGDWSAIFTSEVGKISESLAPLPFLIFTCFMITGRLSTTRLQKLFGIQRLVTWGGILGGIGFLFGIWGVAHFGLVGLMFAFALAGIGTASIAPAFMNIANAKIDLPPSIVVGQLAASNILLSWIIKQIIAFLAQFAGLQVALTIPALMALSVGYFARVFNTVPAK